MVRAARMLCEGYCRLPILLVLSAVFVIAAPAHANSPPVADAGPDQSIFVDQLTGLGGNATDPDGDEIVDWLWVVDSSPAGSNPVIGQPWNPDSLFSADIAGDYVLALIASDGTDWSVPDYVTISVAEILRPVAVADADVTSGPAPLTVRFDASQSYDPQGGTLMYDWYFGDGSALPEVSPTHEYLFPGTYLAQLTLIDARGQVDIDTIMITVTAPGVNIPPIAHAGDDQAMLLGDTIELQGSATDPEGDPIVQWRWWIASQPPGSTPVFGPTTEPNPDFIPDVLGDYVLALRASDGEFSELSDRVTVRVVENLPPIAVASSDLFSGPAPLTVTFDGSQSVDPEGGALTYDCALLKTLCSTPDYHQVVR